jgi:hypothetical protein
MSVVSQDVLSRDMPLSPAAGSSLRLFARPALGFAGSTVLATALMILVSMI